MGISQYN